MEAASAAARHRLESAGAILYIAQVMVLIRRAANELLRVPGAAIPGVLAPTIFFLGITSVFGNLTLLPGFTTDTYQSFVIPVSLLQGAGFTGAATGVDWPGLDGMVIALLLVAGMGTVAALWGVTIALRFKSQSAAPLMQAGAFVFILTTTAYAPLDLLQGWLQDLARTNPVTQIVEAVRQGFIGGGGGGGAPPGPPPPPRPPPHPFPPPP